METEICDRSQPGFLLELLSDLEKDVTSSQVLKKDRENTIEGWGLLVEGLETFSVLTKNKKHALADM